MLIKPIPVLIKLIPLLISPFLCYVYLLAVLKRIIMLIKSRQALTKLLVYDKSDINKHLTRMTSSGARGIPGIHLAVLWTAQPFLVLFIFLWGGIPLK